jgi:hypothetical protein
MVPMGKAIEELVDLSYEIYNRVFRKVPDRLEFLFRICTAHFPVQNLTSQ